MFQISDGNGPLFTLDSMQEAFRIALAGSIHEIVYVLNMDNGHEVMMSGRRVVASNNPQPHNHGNGNGPVCTILNCGE